MLFLLTGDVQIGKTRWLDVLVNDLRTRGVACAGVMAPGLWVSLAEGADPAHIDANGFEKRGINNVLLPQGEVVPFALRRDIAQVQGAFDEASQSARADLLWEIDDNAIARVNEHFKELSGRAEGALTSDAPEFLVVDELGRLELLRGAGLTSAVALLERGPSAIIPHALVVVRDCLAPDAERLLGDAWGQIMCISPNEEGREAIFAAYEL